MKVSWDVVRSDEKKKRWLFPTLVDRGRGRRRDREREGDSKELVCTRARTWRSKFSYPLSLLKQEPVNPGHVKPKGFCVVAELIFDFSFPWDKIDIIFDIHFFGFKEMVIMQSRTLYKTSTNNFTHLFTIIQKPPIERENINRLFSHAKILEIEGSQSRKKFKRNTDSIFADRTMNIYNECLNLNV